MYAVLSQPLQPCTEDENPGLRLSCFSGKQVDEVDFVFYQSSGKAAWNEDAPKESGYPLLSALHVRTLYVFLIEGGY